MLLKVKVFPNSKKESVIKKSEDNFEIRIKEKPIRGGANKRVLQVLSLHFKVPFAKIKLVKGHKTRNKIFKINK